MTDRIIPLPDGRFSVSREDLELFRSAIWERAIVITRREPDGPSDVYRIAADAISDALNKDTTDETA